LVFSINYAATTCRGRGITPIFAGCSFLTKPTPRCRFSDLPTWRLCPRLPLNKSPFADLMHARVCWLPGFVVCGFFFFFSFYGCVFFFFFFRSISLHFLFISPFSLRSPLVFFFFFVSIGAYVVVLSFPNHFPKGFFLAGLRPTTCRVFTLILRYLPRATLSGRLLPFACSPAAPPYPRRSSTLS